MICRDPGRVFSVPQLLSTGKDVVEDVLSRDAAQREAAKFIRDFVREQVHVYRCARKTLLASFHDHQSVMQASHSHLSILLCVPMPAEKR